MIAWWIVAAVALWVAWGALLALNALRKRVGVLAADLETLVARIAAVERRLREHDERLKRGDR